MFNLFLILAILILWIFFLYQISKKSDQDESTVNIYDTNYLAQEVRNCFTDAVNIDLSKLNMRQSELEKRKNNRNLLRKALRTCAYGDAGAKDFVKDYMKQILQKKCNVTPETIDLILPFERPEELTARDRFEFLLYIYRVKKGFGRNALSKLLIDYNLEALKEEKDGKRHYEVNEEDIREVYIDEVRCLNYQDKLEIVVQRIFSMDKGNGVIDDIIFQKIDGVSGGVSGVPEETFASVWIMFHGKSIHMSCLSFETERELKRVCKNIYKYEAPGQMSQASGFIVNSLKSGARVSDMRPPFSSSWAFWIRMFDSVEKHLIKELYPQNGNGYLERILYFIVKGEQTCVVSGQQGTGKTTCLEAMIAFINPVYNIRTIELTFELQLQRMYPQLNIAAMRETKTVTTEQAIEFVKKTDADVVIFGEIAKETEGEKVIKLAQSGSRFSMSTHHGITTRALISWFRNALLHSSGFQNEKIAESQVAEAIRFDIHLAKKAEGERFVERITEIIPGGDFKSYEVKEILSYQDGCYQLKHPISSETCKNIIWNLSGEEKLELERLMEGIN